MAKAKRARLGCAAAAVISPAILLVWAACIEPRWLEVTHQEVALRVTAPLVVAHLSDVHTHAIGGLERATLEAVERARPDVIVITGDLYDRAEDKNTAQQFLSKLSAPLGVFYVPGNWEHWRARDLEISGATMLLNKSARLRDDVFLVGVDDALAGVPNLKSAVADVPVGVATIALFHSPAFFDDAAARVDLALAGHTHGGQVRVPLLGAIWLPPQSGEYVAGLYRRGGASLYVSRGIGTSILPLRFNCRPELAIIRVVPSGTKRARPRTGA